MIETRLIFDSGTLILIWLVQLIIYPSFRYYAEDTFREFHQKYTRLLSYIIVPLIGGQGISVAYQFFTNMNWYTFTASCFITAVVVYTFLYFVPLHLKLEKEYSLEHVQLLVSRNWYRTILWSALWLLDIGYWLIH